MLFNIFLHPSRSPASSCRLSLNCRPEGQKVVRAPFGYTKKEYVPCPPEELAGCPLRAPTQKPAGTGPARASIARVSLDRSCCFAAEPHAGVPRDIHLGQSRLCSCYSSEFERPCINTPSLSQVNFLLVSKFAVWLSYFDVQRLYYTNKVVNCGRYFELLRLVSYFRRPLWF
jgi:hypothetical protein